MITGNVRGRAELRKVQGIIAAQPAKMQASIATGTRRVLRQVRPEVKAEALVRLPKRGGYARVMSSAVRAATSVRQAGARIIATVTVSARGRRKERDVASVNRGVIRHPLFGNRSRWYTTLAVPGFASTPLDRARDRIVDVAREARDDAAERIVRE